MCFSLAVGPCSTSMIISSLSGADEWGEFPNVRLHCNAWLRSKEIRKTNLDHPTARTELNAVLFFSTTLCNAVLNPAGNRISSCHLFDCTFECSFP